MARVPKSYEEHFGVATGRSKRSGKPFWHGYDEIVADAKVVSFFVGNIDATSCEGEISSYRTLGVSATMSSPRSAIAEWVLINVIV